MSFNEIGNVPEIGAVVRCKAPLVGSPKGSSGCVTAILAGGEGPTVVIQSIWGVEITISAINYHRYFEECDSQDVAREYWASA
jgi:hypothetical protein